MIDILTKLIIASWDVTCEMAPYLLFGFAVAGILSVCIPTSWIQRHLGRRGPMPIITASVVGVPLPLCSCSVIPVVASIRKSGATRAASTSFLLSTPQTGADSIAVTYGLLGPVFAVFRAVVALVTGIIGGLVVHWWVDRRTPEADSKNAPGVSSTSCCCGNWAEVGAKVAAPAEGTLGDDACGQAAGGEDTSCGHEEETCCGTQPVKKEMKDPAASCSHPRAMPSKVSASLTAALRHGFLVLPRDIGASLVIGVLIAAAMTVVVPKNQLHQFLDLGVFSMLLVMVASVPLYVCATASVPIALGLLNMGASPGTALAFLIAGPATNAATVSVIMRMLGKGTMIVYLLVIVASAIGFGLLLDVIMPEWLPPTGVAGEEGHMHHELASSWLPHLWGIALVVVIIASSKTLARIAGRWGRRSETT